MEGKTVISYIGTQGAAHGLENAIGAANLLRDRDDIRLLFVGTGAANSALVKQTEQLRLNNVLFVPQQPKSLISDYWNLSDIALIHLRGVPVMRTVISSKAFEAMCFGLPILLVAPDGEITRLVKETESGIIVEPENPSALADAIRAMADNTPLLRALAEKSKRSAPRFSREQQARNMLSVLEAVARDGTSKMR